MTTYAAERRILEIHKRGGRVTPADVCETISSLPELKSYAAGLQANGKYNDEARDAVEHREAAIRQGRG